VNSFFLNTDWFPNFENKAEKLRFVVLLLFVFALPFDIFYSNITFITLCATTLVDTNLKKIKQIPKQFWLFQLIYFLTATGYFYSNHKSVAAFLLERQLLILFFPLIIPLAVKLTDARIRFIMVSFVIATLSAICYLFASMCYSVIFVMQLPFLKTIFSGAFFNHQFSNPLNIHAGYLSLYVSLSIFHIVFLFKKASTYQTRILITFSLIVLFAGLFFLAARNSIIATLIILLFVFPLFKIKNKIRYIAVSVSILLVSFFAISQISYLKARFSSALIIDIKPLAGNSNIQYQGAEPRFERWVGAFDLIKKSPLIGYGTGDEIAMLRTRYLKRELYISYLESFNAHNQYISYLIKNGILGFCVFLIAFIYYLFLAIKHRDFLYLSFLLLLLIGFYTENILDANKGIIFFAFFNTCFGYNILMNRSPKGLASVSPHLHVKSL